MKIGKIRKVYFLGIGGIGMSALARFFLKLGATVIGYDRTKTPLTEKLEAEGMHIHYTEDITQINNDIQLVVYTPAIPANNLELMYFKERRFSLFKRSEILKFITDTMYNITVAGTHGKTSISTLIAFLLRETNYGCNAFLGGIPVNYDTNYWSSDNNISVVEADEYDRSFLRLRPDIAILTAIDADHLDIYQSVNEMEKAYIAYTRNISKCGTLLKKYGLHRKNELKGPKTITYSLDNINADYYGSNIRLVDNGYVFDFVSKNITITDINIKIGGIHNIENAIAAIAVTQLLGIDAKKVKEALLSFRGVKRRFEFIVVNDKTVYIDDYAHHPQELLALINGAKSMFPNRKCVVCFQPHLFSRTRDFADDFANSLDMADEVILLDIYPARELPIEGVTSNTIAEKMKNTNHKILSKDGLLEYVKNNSFELFITAGAGDIDKLVEPIKNIFIK